MKLDASLIVFLVFMGLFPAMLIIGFVTSVFNPRCKRCKVKGFCVDGEYGVYVCPKCHERIAP